MDFAHLALPTTLYGFLALAQVPFSLFLYYRYNNLKAIKQDNKDLQDIINSKDKIIEEFRAAIGELKKQVFELQVSLKAKDERIATLEQVQVIQSVNPDVLTYMSEMKNFANDAEDFIKQARKQWKIPDKRKKGMST
jgi:DNA repair exonuclease SbcCD ATPase subunit